MLKRNLEATSRYMLCIPALFANCPFVSFFCYGDMIRRHSENAKLRQERDMLKWQQQQQQQQLNRLLQQSTAPSNDPKSLEQSFCSPSNDQVAGFFEALDALGTGGGSTAGSSGNQAVDASSPLQRDVSECADDGSSSSSSSNSWPAESVSPVMTHSQPFTAALENPSTSAAQPPNSSESHFKTPSPRACASATPSQHTPSPASTLPLQFSPGQRAVIVGIAPELDGRLCIFMGVCG